MNPQLEPEIAANYQSLVDAGDRTWADVAAMADAQDAPALAAYARQRIEKQPAAPTDDEPSQRPPAARTASER